MPTADDALQLTACDWRVIPLHVQGKRPKLNEWHKKATTDEDTVTEWWSKWPDANIGVAMGPESGIIDIETDSEEGEKLFSELFDGYELVTPTFSSSRGKHRLFKWTGDLPCSDKATVRLGDVDFKIGGGGKGSYSIFPPSVHPDGPQYTWDVPPEACEPAEIPAEVVARISTKLVEGNGDAPAAKGKPAEYWDRVYKGVSQGQRNQKAAEFIGRELSSLRDPYDENEVSHKWEVALAWNDRNKPPLPAEELRRTFESILRSEREKYTNTKDRDEYESQIARDQQTGLMQDESWRLVKRLSQPVEWKLYSPLWTGPVILSTDQLMTYKRLAIQVADQADYVLEDWFRPLWTGWKNKKTGEWIRGKLHELMKNREVEDVPPESRRENRIASLIWENCISKYREADDNEPDGRGVPRQLADGSIWFKHQYVQKNIDKREDVSSKELSDLLGEIGATDHQRRVNGVKTRFKRLSPEALERLKGMALYVSQQQENADDDPDANRQAV